MKVPNHPCLHLIEKHYSCRVCGCFLCYAVEFLVCSNEHTHTNLICKAQVDFDFSAEARSSGFTEDQIQDSISIVTDFLRRSHEVSLCVR